MAPRSLDLNAQCICGKRFARIAAMNHHKATDATHATKFRIQHAQEKPENVRKRNVKKIVFRGETNEQDSTTQKVICGCGKRFKSIDSMYQHMRDSPYHNSSSKAAPQNSGKVQCECQRSFEKVSAWTQHNRDSSGHVGPHAEAVIHSYPTQRILQLQPTWSRVRVLNQPQKMPDTSTVSGRRGCHQIPGGRSEAKRPRAADKSRANQNGTATNSAQPATTDRPSKMDLNSSHPVIMNYIQIFGVYDCPYMFRTYARITKKDMRRKKPIDQNEESYYRVYDRKAFAEAEKWFKSNLGPKSDEFGKKGVKFGRSWLEQPV